MNLTAKQRAELDKKRRNGTVYSDLLIYGVVKFADGEYRPNVSTVARVELSRAAGDPAALATIVERHAAKSSVPTALLDVICVVTAQGIGALANAGARAQHADGVTACASALQKLLAGRRSMPMFGEDAIAAVVAFWFASKTKPAKLTTVLEQLVPAEVGEGPLATPAAAFRKAVAAKSPKRA